MAELMKLRGPIRKQKARELTIEAHPELGKRIYLVWRQEEDAEPHWVNLGDPMTPDCDCGDFIYRGRLCKHVYAAQLLEESERKNGG